MTVSNKLMFHPRVTQVDKILKNIVSKSVNSLKFTVNIFCCTENSIKLNSQPRGMDVKGDLIITASVKEITIVQNSKKISALPINYEPSSVSVNPSSNDVAVGSTSDNKVMIQ